MCFLVMLFKMNVKFVGIKKIKMGKKLQTIDVTYVHFEIGIVRGRQTNIDLDITLQYVITEKKCLPVKLN